MPGGDYASGPVVRLHRQRVWIWITEWIEQDEGNTSGMQFVPSKSLAQDMDSALDGICTENIEMYCKAFQSMKRTYEEKMRVQIENL